MQHRKSFGVFDLPNMRHPSAPNYRLYLLHLRFAQYAEPGAPNYQANHWICIFCMPPWDENINCTFGTSKLRMYIFVNYNSNKLLCKWCDPLATNRHAIHAKHDAFHLVCLMIKLTKWKFNTILMYLLRDSKLHLLIVLFAIRFFFLALLIQIGVLKVQNLINLFPFVVTGYGFFRLLTFFSIPLFKTLTTLPEIHSNTIESLGSTGCLRFELFFYSLTKWH